MSTTFTGLINEALNILQKNSGTQGFYTTAKMETFTNEAIDYLSCRMMEAGSGEWLETSGYISTNAGDNVFALPTDTVVVKKVSYLIGNVYQPLVYNELRQDVTYVSSTFTFTVAGVVVSPAVGDTYTNTGSTYKISAVSLVAGAGVITMDKTNGTNNPATPPGVLARVAGGGDVAIAYSAVQVNSSGIQQYPSSYFLQGSNIVFDPPLAIGGTNALKIDYTAFPAEMTGAATLPTILHRAFQHYVAYRAAYTAASSIGKAQKEWADTYGEWMDMMLRMVDKRVDQPRWVKEYDQ